MFSPGRYRTKAAEYTELAKMAQSPEAARRFAELERSFTSLADNEQWLNDNYDQTVHWPSGGNEEADMKPLTPLTVAVEDDEILRYLGAALIMQWNTVPRKLQRELFDKAGSMGELLETTALRAQIARFLHNHKNDEQ
jgi:hypothetical protein